MPAKDCSDVDSDCSKWHFLKLTLKLNHCKNRASDCRLTMHLGAETQPNLDRLGMLRLLRLQKFSLKLQELTLRVHLCNPGNPGRLLFPENLRAEISLSGFWSNNCLDFLVDFSVDFFLLVFPRKMAPRNPRKNPPKNPPPKPNTKIHQKFQGRGVLEKILEQKNDSQFSGPKNQMSNFWRLGLVNPSNLSRRFRVETLQKLTSNLFFTIRVPRLAEMRDAQTAKLQKRMRQD